jgi:hypothetical protein
MEHFRKVAQQIKSKLDEGNYSFITIDYSELLSMYRNVAGGEVRLSKNVRTGLEKALSDVGIKVFPSIEDTEVAAVRFFRAPTILWDIVTNLRYPDDTSDGRLAALIKRIKEDPTVEIHIMSR